MTGIFISYSRKDSTVAHKLMDAFKSIDLDVWVDWEDIPPAVGWLDQILQGIEAADAFLFLVSPDSVASEVCNVELEHAHKNSKRIIPIVVREVDPKTTRPTIRDLNWIFIRESDDFDAGLEKIKVAINLDVDWLQEHRRLQVRALEWDRKKDPSLLLHGGDLRNAARMILAHEGKDPTPSDLQKLYLSHSQKSERVRTITWVSAALAVVIMALLSLFAFNQRRVALINAEEADKQRALAEENEDTAIQNARAALIAKAAADKNATIAKAQRSAARAQIYQSRTGGLFTSTLLGVDSYLRNPSLEAEEILRENISLLPAPVSQIEQEGAILTLEVSPDGGSFVSTSAGGGACLTRFEDGKSLFCVTGPGSMLDAAFSPDGKILVVSSSEGRVVILDAQTGKMINELNYGVTVRDVNISPDGKLLAIARDDARISLVSIPSYGFAGEFSVFGSLRVTAFSPNGDWFAAGSNFGAITFWNLDTGKIVTGSAHSGEVRDLTFSPDSRTLLSGGTDNCAILTSPATGKEVRKVLAEEWVEDVDFSPDGSWFVTASNDFRIRVWDTRTGEERLRLLQDSIVNEIKVSPNGLWIASTGSDRTVRVWSAADGAQMFQIPLANVGNVLAFSGDGSYLVTGDSDGNISIWDISTLESNIGFIRFDDFVRNIEPGPDSDWFAASAGGQVWLLDPELFPTLTAPQGKPILDFVDDDVIDLTANPEGTLLAVSTVEGKVLVIDTARLGIRSLIENGPAQKILFQPDGKSLLLAGDDGLLQSRSLESRESGVLWQGNSSIYSMAVSPGNLLALGLDDKVVLFDLASKAVIEELNSPGRNHLVAFNSDGSMLVSNTLSGQTLIWKSNGGSLELFASLKGNTAASLSFAPDGSRLFLGGSDRVVVYDPLTGAELNRIRHKGDVTDLAISADGNTLFTATLRTLQLFDVASMNVISGADIAASACSRLTRNFSAAEWTSFFDDEEYRILCPALP